MTSSRRIIHLVRRAMSSTVARRLTEVELTQVQDVLSESEWALWLKLSRADQRHSFMIGMRFDRLCPDAPRTALAGAFLHDIGKSESKIGTASRVATTLIGPYSPRTKRYHDHEHIGEQLLVAANSDSVTIDTACGRGRWGASLRQADDV